MSTVSQFMYSNPWLAFFFKNEIKRLAALKTFLQWSWNSFQIQMTEKKYCFKVHWESISNFTAWKKTSMQNFACSRDWTCSLWLQIMSWKVKRTSIECDFSKRSTPFDWSDFSIRCPVQTKLHFKPNFKDVKSNFICSFRASLDCTG